MNRPTPRRLLPALLGGLLLLTGTGCQSNEPAAAADPAPNPVVAPASATRGLVDWSKPLVLTVKDGELRDVVVTDPAGYPVAGALAGGRWTSRTSLVPSGGYHVRAVVEDRAGDRRELDLTVRTTRATKVLTAMHSPRSDRVVGVGLPAIINLSRSVRDPEDRRAVVQRLRVVSEPHVDGAWRWMSDRELHYRGPTYWAKGTRISVHSDLEGLRLSKGLWGSGSVDTTFSVGSAVVSVVDVATKSMTVTVDGKLVRTLKVSTGRDEFPTKGGVHLVLEKTKLKTMDSATVGIPRDSPEGYYLKVPNSVRISYGGAFVHSASWSVRDQGVRNVSHGCVNLSPADAEWFHDLVKRGDVVSIINAKAKPRLTDPGTWDWNVPWSDWAN